MTTREPLHVDMMASLALFAAGGIVLAFVMADRLPLSAYLMAHVACSVSAILLVVLQGRTPRRQSLLLALATTSMGPAGSAGVFISTIFELCFRPYARPFTEWFAGIFPEDDDKSRQGFLDMLHTSEDPVTTSLRISSFRDTMAAGTIEQKQALLGLIARRFSPAFAPALKQALGDATPAVRVQAAAAVASIEGRFAERTFELEERARREGATIHDRLALARHLIAFAESGIAESQRVEEAHASARRELDAVLKSDPDNVEALAASASLLLHVDHPAEAHERIRRCMDIQGETPALCSLHLQALMSLGRYDDIRALASPWQRISKSGDQDAAKLGAAARLWQRGASHAV